jgi:hypothetical protein
MLIGNALAVRMGAFAGMIGRGACRIDLKIGLQRPLVHQMLKDALCRRASANITQTHKANFKRVFLRNFSVCHRLNHFIFIKD